MHWDDLGISHDGQTQLAKDSKIESESSVDDLSSPFYDLKMTEDDKALARDDTGILGDNGSSDLEDLEQVGCFSLPNKVI
jgi:hypothetical protein